MLVCCEAPDQNSLVDYKKWIIDNDVTEFSNLGEPIFKMIELLVLDNWTSIEEECKNNQHKAE